MSRECRCNGKCGALCKCKQRAHGKDVKNPK
jgi:hypothetical protein